jgi:hypothetical protein
MLNNLIIRRRDVSPAAAPYRWWLPTPARISTSRLILSQSKENAMADDPKKTALDRKLISLTEEHEVRSWTKSLGVTEEELRKAVAAVGNSAEAVRVHLGKK